MVATAFDYQATKNDIILRALRICGAMSFGDTLTADMSTLGSIALNGMIKSWQNENVFLWTLTENTIALAVGIKSYITPTSVPIIGIEQAYFSNTNSDTPLEVISYRQYEEIYNKDAPGQPSAICFVQSEPPTFLVWPVPTVIGNIKYLGITKLQDFDAGGDTAGFPAKWTEALTYGLTARICDEFPMPLQEKLYYKQLAKDTLKSAKRGNVEEGSNDFVEGLFPISRC